MEIHRRLANTVLGRLRQPHDYATKKYPNYHDFGKLRFPDELLEQWCDQLAIVVAQWQVEIGLVSGDLTHQKHHHNHADAWIEVLGPEFGFPKPENFQKYVDGVWVPARAGEIVEIPAGKVHGFTIKPGCTGKAYFLTIQTPPIVGTGGEDDYHLDL